MAEEVSQLVERVRLLEVRDDGTSQLIVDLETENKNLKTQMKNMMKRLDSLQRLEDLRKASVFSARCKPSADLSDKNWKTVDETTIIYKASVHFNTETCVFVSPIKGDYFLNLGFRQDGMGCIEAMLRFTSPVRGVQGDASTSPTSHAYVGLTNLQSQVCNKSVVLSLQAGDKVFAVTRRMTGTATVQWCVLHGYLITGEIPA